MQVCLLMLVVRRDLIGGCLHMASVHAFTDDIRVLRVSISEEQVRNVWHFDDVVSEIA